VKHERCEIRSVYKGMFGGLLWVRHKRVRLEMLGHCGQAKPRPRVEDVAWVTS
jgi:hypothetical protein